MHNYDTIPYESLPFAETHPQRLSLLGRFFGIATTDPDNCRFLELGSASGGNLIPMAWYNPRCEFVGIELEAKQVAAGQKIIDATGLQNIQLLQGDIAEIGHELGEFDFIVTHGVYSWIPDQVRAAMLQLYKKCLKPNGIGYISFNTRPGWHARSMIREMLMYHLRDTADPVDRLNRALTYIDMMVDVHSALDTAQSRYLLEEFRYMQTAHPSYVFHEFLEEYNQAFFFRDFVTDIGHHQLRFLCESQLGSMFASRYGAKAEACVDNYPDITEQEQYLDYFSQRTLRQSLICHQQVTPDYDIDLSILDTLACNSNLKPPARLDLRNNRPQSFVSASGKQYEITDPIARLMLQSIYQSYPDAVFLNQVLADVQQEFLTKTREQAPTENADWQTEIFSLFASDALQLVQSEVRFDRTIRDTPCAHELARSQVMSGQQPVSPWLETINLDTFARQLLVYLDGSRNLDMLAEQLLHDIINGQLVIDDLTSLSKHKLQQQVTTNIRRLLTLFSQSGLLVSSVSK